MLPEKASYVPVVMIASADDGMTRVVSVLGEKKRTPGPTSPVTGSHRWNCPFTCVIFVMRTRQTPGVGVTKRISASSDPLNISTIE